MSHWSPEAQHGSIKFSAYMALFSAFVFGVLLTKRLMDAADFNNTYISSGVLALGALALVTMILLEFRRSESLYGGWRELFSRYTDEFLKTVYQKANSRAFIAIVVLLIPGFIVGEELMTPELSIYFNISTFSSLLIIASTFVWGVTVLWEIRDADDEPEHGQGA